MTKPTALYYGFIKDQKLPHLRFLVVFMLFLSQCSLFRAQNFAEVPTKEVVAIAVTNGAEIHSMDAAFNHLISQSKIVTGSVTVSSKEENGEAKIIIRSQVPLPKRPDTVAPHQKGPQVQQIQNTLKKFEKELGQYQKQKSSVQAGRIKLPFSAAYFFRSGHHAQLYPFPSITSHQFSNIYRTAHCLVLKPALDYLYVRTGDFYNHRFSCPSFLAILLVRPPPVSA